METVIVMSRIKKIGIALILPIVAGMSLCAWMILGYGRARVPERVEENTLSLSKDGTVRLYLVGEFDKTYYDLPELSRMAMDEAAAYNAEHSASGKAAIVVDKVERDGEDGRIRVNYTFADAEAFVGLNGGVLFYGTLHEAVEAGYNLEAVAFANVKDGSMTMGAALASSAAGRHILITDQKALLYCPYGAAYVSEGAMRREDGAVDAAKADGSVFVLMKR